jgi:hypothetical protein
MSYDCVLTRKSQIRSKLYSTKIKGQCSNSSRIRQRLRLALARAILAKFVHTNRIIKLSIESQTATGCSLEDNEEDHCSTDEELTGI